MPKNRSALPARRSKPARASSTLNARKRFGLQVSKHNQRGARPWISEAVNTIEADFNRSADMHPVPVTLPGHPEIRLYLEDESTHASGSLKHRLARSLLLYSLCNGWIGPRITIVEASSSSTAVSEASVFHRHLDDPDVITVPGPCSVVEGIGLARLEPSLLPQLIDRWVAVPDATSLGATRALAEVLGISCGASTGANLWARITVIGEMVQRGEAGSVVTLLCGSGKRYRSTHLDDARTPARGLGLWGPMRRMLEFMVRTDPGATA